MLSTIRISFTVFFVSLVYGKTFAATQNWALDSMQVESAWHLNATGKGIKICSIDGGIDLANPIIQQKIVEAKNFQETSNSVPYPEFDERNHGTPAASVISGGVLNGISYGVAPDAEIYVAKWYGIAPPVEGDWMKELKKLLPQMLDWCLSKKVNVIVTTVAIQDGVLSEPGVPYKYENILEKNNVVWVSSAGNDTSEPPLFPAAYSTVIGVGGVDRNLQSTEFTARGQHVDVVAPGWQVLSACAKDFCKDTKSSIFVTSKETSQFVDIWFPVQVPNAPNIYLTDKVPESEVVLVNGFGEQADYVGLDVKNKITLVKRGKNSRRNKSILATRAGARGVIIYNNDDSDPSGLQLSGDDADTDLVVPTIYITKTVGENWAQQLQSGQRILTSFEALNFDLMPSVPFQSDFAATSAAAPLVAGVVALMQSANPKITPQQVRDILIQTSYFPSEIQKQYSKGGLIDAYKAVNSAVALKK